MSQTEHKVYNHEALSMEESIDINLRNLGDKMNKLQKELHQGEKRSSEVIEGYENSDLTRREMAFIIDNHSEILRGIQSNPVGQVLLEKVAKQHCSECDEAKAALEGEVIEATDVPTEEKSE